MTDTVVHVDLGARSYDVVCGHGLLDRAGALIAPFAPKRRVIVVADSSVQRLHGARLQAGLAAFGISDAWIAVAPGEASKSWEGLAYVCAQLAALQAERGDLLVAFGGGVIGDLAGLAAGLFKRGMDFVQIPTTLLAQVDSSVGGKTAIDIAAGKNLVGLFHQPRLVLADFDTLASLSERELRAGFAEVVKYGLINDAAFFAWTQARGGDVLALVPDAIAHAVVTSVQAKARIVAFDERESGPRALLNLGHTFGHAFETIAGYDGVVLHGEAVALGMALAFRYAADCGDCAVSDSELVAESLQASGFVTDPVLLPGGPYATPALMDAMANDKKAEGGKLTLILPQAIGRTRVVKGIDRAMVAAFLNRELQA